MSKALPKVEPGIRFSGGEAYDILMAAFLSLYDEEPCKEMFELFDITLQDAELYRASNGVNVHRIVQ